MKLTELFSCLQVNVGQLPCWEITSITENSRYATQNSLFVCIQGFRADGHQFAADAYCRGCRAFLAEHSLDLPEDAVVVVVEDTHEALGLLACAFYKNPSHSLTLIGITGTKGKTTVACMLREILESNGISCGYVGTNGIAYGNVTFQTKNTTPDAITLQKSLADMRAFGCRAAVIEVSSQALKLHRVAGTRFACGVFTNLTSDHIGAGEHTDFDDYLSCKNRLFANFDLQTAVFLADDRNAEKVLHGTSAKRIACSLGTDGNYIAKEVSPFRSASQLGISFIISNGKETQNFSIPMIGSFNAANALLSAAVAAECFEISLQKSANILKNARILGRSEVYALPSGALAVIDYAHNGESLRRLLGSLRQYEPRRLICLFGSVGERTHLRRTELGQAAAELADLCILTSDNPGNESPEKIISDIAAAFAESQTPYISIPDRADAIRKGVRLTEKGDILVLAGKGHEAYQKIGNESIPFSERDILLQEALSAEIK